MSINIGRVKRLLSELDNELVSILNRVDFPPNTKVTLKMNDKDDNASKKVSSEVLVDELVQLKENVTVFTDSLGHYPETFEDDELIDSEDAHFYVTVCGPPGTEFIDDVSKARFDELQSIVYSRTSSGVTILPCRAPSQIEVRSIPPKDTPPLRVEVYARPTHPSRSLRNKKHWSLSSTSSSAPSSPVSSIGSSFRFQKSPVAPRRSGLRSRHRGEDKASNKLSESRSSTMSPNNSPSLLSNCVTQVDEGGINMENLNPTGEGEGIMINSDVFMGSEHEEVESTFDQDESYYTAEEELEETKEPLHQPHRTDLMKSTWYAFGEVTSDVDVKAEDVDGSFIEQASTDDSDIQQIALASNLEGETMLSRNSSSDESFGDIVKNRILARTTRAKRKDSPAFPSAKAESQMFTKDLQVVIQKLPLKSFSNQLKRLKPSPSRLHLYHSSQRKDPAISKGKQMTRAGAKKSLVRDDHESQDLLNVHGGGSMEGSISPVKVESYNQNGSVMKRSRDHELPTKRKVKGSMLKIEVEKGVYSQNGLPIKIKVEKGSYNHNGSLMKVNDSEERGSPDQMMQNESECKDVNRKDSKVREGTHKRRYDSFSTSSNDDITFSDVVNDAIGNFPLSDTPEPMASGSHPYLNKTPPHSKKKYSTLDKPMEGSDSDFDMTLHNQYFQNHPHTDPPLRKRKKKTMKNYNSEDEERPFTPFFMGKAKRKMVRRKLEDRLNESKRLESSEEEGKRRVREERVPKKILEYGSDQEMQYSNNEIDQEESSVGDDTMEGVGVMDEGVGVMDEVVDVMDEGVGVMDKGVAVMDKGVGLSVKNSLGKVTPSMTTMKLGKHIKGLHSKGKEKWVPPDVIKCTACGKEVYWKIQKIHVHKCLKVPTCQQCYKMWNTGEFRKIGSHEIFCSLCGDGGDIILCDYCDKSFCHSCVDRISGTEQLQYLKDVETAEFQCYLCDSSPLRDEQELCQELISFFKKSKGGERSGLRSGKKFKSKKYITGSDMDSSHDDEGGVGCGVVDGEGENQKGVGSSHQEGSKSHDNSKFGKGSDERVESRKLRRQQRKVLGRFGDESSHSDDDSPQVNSDDIELSDSSITEDMEAVMKEKKGKKVLQKRTKIFQKSPSSDEDNSDGDKKKSEGDEKRKERLRRRRRRKAGLFPCGSPTDEDSSDDDRTEVRKRRSKRKRSTTSESLSDVNKCEKQQNISSKKSRRFAVPLSSDSDREEKDDSRMLTVQLSDQDMGEDDMGEDDIVNRAASTRTCDSAPIKYRIPDIESSGSSSDFKSTLSRKVKKKSGDQIGILSSSDDESESDPRQKSRSRQKKEITMADLSSDEDFVGRHNTLKGPRSRHRRVIPVSDSDTNSNKSGDEEQKSSSMKKDEDITPSQELTPRKRKKIRKVIGEAKLANETKIALQEERERMERLKKRKNVTLDEEDRLVLEQDPESKEIKIEVRRSLVPNIKPHQWEGIKFLYDACVENLQRFASGYGAGAILAHCMGLGKTLQVIAFADALLNCEESGMKRVLVLCPVNTVHNWKVEFFKWIPFLSCEYKVYLLTETGVRGRLGKLRKWFFNGGIIFMGYEMFRSLAISKTVKNRKNKEEFKKFLLDPGADMVVCDEGHVMRNSNSSLSMIVNQVKTKFRVVLTGTPLQNNLQEYYTMVNFVKPNLLGMPKEFKNRFVNPITHGQCRDSSPLDIRTMKQRAHVLYTLLKDTVQRQDFRVLAKSLPPKKEFVLNIRLSSVQDQLYQRFLKRKSHFEAADLFTSYATLSKIWNHPWVLKLDEQRKFEKAEREAAYGLSDYDDDDDDDSTLGGFIVLDSEDSSVGSKNGKRRKNHELKGRLTTGRSVSVTSSSPAGTPVNVPNTITISSDSDEEFLPKINLKTEPKTDHADDNTDNKGAEKGEDTSGVAINKNAGTRAQSAEATPPSSWYENLVGDNCEEMLELSGKLIFLFELLEQTKQLKEKVLVFSQSLLTLDLIEEFLSKPKFGDWIRAVDYYRLDGSTSADMRTANMSEFNQTDNERLRLFLISTRAGSLGVNLIAANRVVIFDACWNPSHDLQAIFRAYRYGQVKPVFVYRLLAQGTMEEKIYDRQVTKQSLSMRVVDKKQIGRHYSSSDLAELFSYTPPPPPPDTKPVKPYNRPEEDVILCKILDKIQPDWVTAYHEHDSLLEHIDDEELSEEERKAAWDLYNQQIATESARFNLERLHAQLNSSSPQEGAAIQVNPPLTNIVTSIIILTAQTIKQIQDLKANSQRINLLKRVYSNSTNIPQLAQHEIVSLEQIIQRGYRILGEKIKMVNQAISGFSSSNLASQFPLVGKVNEQRQLIYNQLEELRLLSTPSNNLSNFPPRQPILTSSSALATTQPFVSQSVMLQHQPPHHQQPVNIHESVSSTTMDVPHS